MFCFSMQINDEFTITLIFYACSLTATTTKKEKKKIEKVLNSCEIERNMFAYLVSFSILFLKENEKFQQINQYSSAGEFKSVCIILGCYEKKKIIKMPTNIYIIL